MTAETMNEIIEELKGTCSCLDWALQGRGLEICDVPQKLLEQLDEEIMECEVCGWWHDSHELNDKQECSDCTEEEGE